MRIGIIGAGRVGTTLGQYLKLKGMEISGIYSRTLEHAIDSAEFIGTTYYEKLENLIKVSDTLFITTPDNMISGVWDCIIKFDLKDKIVCHFSGSLSSDVFRSKEKTGAYVCSIHPIYAFSNKYSAYQQFHKVQLTMEGDDAAVEKMKSCWEAIGHKVRIIQRQDKVKYHAGMSMVSNHVLALIGISVKMLQECGFSEKEAYEAVETLVCENVENGIKQGVVEALTGPIERNDTETVKKHLKVLSNETEKVYRSLGEKLIEISKIKNPDRDYRKMEEIIGG